MLNDVKERHLKLWDEYEVAQTVTDEAREAKALAEINAGKVFQDAQDEKELHNRDLELLAKVRARVQALEEENKSLKAAAEKQKMQTSSYLLRSISSPRKSMSE